MACPAVGRLNQVYRETGGGPSPWSVHTAGVSGFALLIGRARGLARGGRDGDAPAQHQDEKACREPHPPPHQFPPKRRVRRAHQPQTATCGNQGGFARCIPDRIENRAGTRRRRPVPHLPRGCPLECRAAGGGVRGRDRRVPRSGQGPAAGLPAAPARRPHPSGASKPTNCSGPAEGALPSERLVACRWARMEAGDQGRDEVPDERRVALYKVGSHLVLYTPAWVRSATGNSQSYAAFSP
jgi:hypothetical protein